MKYTVFYKLSCGCERRGAEKAIQFLIIQIKFNITKVGLFGFANCVVFFEAPL
jgi:hypothetical protein